MLGRFVKLMMLLGLLGRFRCRVPQYVAIGLVLMALGVCHNSVYADNTTLAIIGDSLSTGAVAHPALRYDRRALLDIFTGKTPILVDDKMRQQMVSNGFAAASDGFFPQRLLPTNREADSGAVSFVMHHAILSFAHHYLDAEELSWGYLVARSLAFAPQNILVAAEDGSRMAAAERQVDRVLDSTGGILPQHVFLFFTGNDLCGPTMDYVTEADDYGEYLTRALLYILQNGKIGGDGSDVWIMDPVGILQLVQSESIQNKVVDAHGKKMRCAELQTYVGEAQHMTPDEAQSYSPVASLFVTQFPRSPAYYCPTVLGLSLDGQGKENQTTLANRLRSYREEIAAAIERVKKHPLFKQAAGKVRFHEITDTGKILFTGDDIANDCFHLSLTGQMKIARVVVDQMHASAGKP